MQSKNQDKNNQAVMSGVNFLELLLLMFIGLKLADKIDWSWWWVFSPVWIPLGLIAVFIIVYVIILIVQNTIKNVKQNNQNGN